MSHAPRSAALDQFRGLAIALMVPANYLEHIAIVPAWLKHAPDIGFTVIDLIAPMFIFALKIGGLITHHEIDFSALHFDATWDNVREVFAQLWLPLVVGCLLCGAAAGALGNAAVRGLWRGAFGSRKAKPVVV